MKAVILAGGLGTRLSEETSSRPKPMIEVGGKPILWHIMKIYASHGINEFVICCGYKGYMIKEYFSNYYLHMSDVTYDMTDNSTIVHNERAESWKVTLIDTGDASMTGGRLRRVKDYVKDDEAFCFTYGDGVANIDITSLIAFHKAHGKLATVTAAYPSGRFGALDIEAGRVNSFQEKPKGDGDMVNAGFFVLNPAVIDLISDDETIWEQQPLTQLAKMNELMAYEHFKFWQPMDTLRDKVSLDNLWSAGQAPWKMW